MCAQWDADEDSSTHQFGSAARPSGGGKFEIKIKDPASAPVSGAAAVNVRLELGKGGAGAAPSGRSRPTSGRPTNFGASAVAAPPKVNKVRARHAAV